MARKWLLKTITNPINHSPIVHMNIYLYIWTLYKLDFTYRFVPFLPREFIYIYIIAWSHFLHCLSSECCVNEWMWESSPVVSKILTLCEGRCQKKSSTGHRTLTVNSVFLVLEWPRYLRQWFSTCRPWHFFFFQMARGCVVDLVLDFVCWIKTMKGLRHFDLS